MFKTLSNLTDEEIKEIKEEQKTNEKKHKRESGKLQNNQPQFKF